MAAHKVEGPILEALEAGADEQELDIVSVEVGGPADHPTLRVRIDVLEDGPIDMERVAAATPWVSEVVEALDPFPGSYELEVSSPGVERPLRRARDFAARIGERVEVVLEAPVDGRRSWTGEVAGVDGEEVALAVDGQTVVFAVPAMKSAKLKPDFDALFAEAKKAEKAKRPPRRPRRRRRAAAPPRTAGPKPTPATSCSTRQEPTRRTRGSTPRTPRSHRLAPCLKGSIETWPLK